MSGVARVRAAIFDFDGTLADSMYVWGELPRELVRRHGGNPPEDMLERIAPLVLDDALEWMRANCLPDMSVESMREELYADIAHHYKSVVLPRPGAQEALERLRERGVRMCVVSATQSELVSAALERFGYAGYFEFVAFADEWGGKSRPDCYLAAAQRLGTQPCETLVYEDALHAAKTAAGAGFRVVGIYDRYSAGDWPELKRVAEWHCRDLSAAMGELG